MADFYGDVLGLEVTGREDGWVDFAAGARAALVKRGLAKAGPVKSTATFDMCDCKDPDGNPFQISRRR